MKRKRKKKDIWDVLFSPKQAMKMREKMREFNAFRIATLCYSEKELAGALKVTPPRIRELRRGKISKFTLRDLRMYFNRLIKYEDVHYPMGK
jgi:predicted XRE-type DNA-binding protein